MTKYIVQVGKVRTKKNHLLQFLMIESRAWNDFAKYDNYEEANEKAIKLIKSGYKADSEVRVIQIVASYETQTVHNVIPQRVGVVVDETANKD